MSEVSSNRQNRGGLKLLIFILVCIAAGFAYVMFAQQGEKSAQAAAPNTPPPPVAEVITVKPEKVRIWTSFSGRLSAVDRADIKPLVGGELQQVLFTDGQLVEKNELLFVIDPRPYKAALASAEAQLASAKSKATLAKDELARTQKLVRDKLVSDSVFDAAKNENQVAIAAISEAESAVSQAKLNLNYCYIRAPFSGRVSRAELTVGNIIETTPSAPVLTTIVANDRFYAEFDVDEQTYIKMMRNTDKEHKMPVDMTLAADESVVYHGDIYSLDNRLDIASGTIRARAIFDNKDGALTPGMYANVKVGSADKQDALLIPSRAIGTNQNKKFVFVINDENQAVYHEVELGGHHQDKRIVLSGLKAGDRVVVNGLSHIRANMVVSPKTVDETDAPVSEE